MISIGTVISGRKIYSIYENKYCLARSVDETAPEPFTVWHIDNDGNGVHTGKYFKFGDDAERHFAWLCFDWFSDEQKEPASEGEAPEQVEFEVFKTCLSSISEEDKIIFAEGLQRIRQLKQLPTMK